MMQPKHGLYHLPPKCTTRQLALGDGVRQAFFPGNRLAQEVHSCATALPVYGLETASTVPYQIGAQIPDLNGNSDLVAARTPDTLSGTAWVKQRTRWSSCAHRVFTALYHPDGDSNR